MSFFTSPGITTDNTITTSATTTNLNVQNGSVIAKEFKIHKDPNKFYEYTLRVLNLKERALPVHNRLLLKVEGTVELGPKASLRDYVMLKHGAEISALDASFEDLTIEINATRSSEIQ